MSIQDVSDPIRVENVSLEFPMVKLQPRTLKEAFFDVLRTNGKNAEGKPRVKSSKTFQALKDVSFRAKRGEVVGIIGRNGSGKSTLLRVIAGIYEPDAGSVVVDGRISSLLELGAGFREELTGYENIHLAGAIMGFSKIQIDTMIPSIVEFAELGEFMAAPLRTYSSGMRSRLGFAVVSELDPEILLIDEALAVGDAQFRERSARRIEDMVAKEDTTVVIVSHETAQLKRLCSRLVLLDGGRTLGDGAPETVLEQYQELIKNSSRKS